MNKALSMMFVLIFLTAPLASAIGYAGPGPAITSAPVPPPALSGQMVPIPPAPVATMSRDETAPTGTVDVTVQNTLAVARPKEVVRLSVPLGHDELMDPNMFKVINAANTAEVLSGFLPSTLDLYDNGSVRRMEVAFQDDLAASETKNYKILLGQAPVLGGTNLTVTKTAFGGTIRDGGKTCTISGDASAGSGGWASASCSGGVGSTFLGPLGGNQLTPDHVSFSAFYGTPTLIEAESNKVMATFHLRYENPSVSYWNGPTKSDADFIWADFRINVYNDRDMLEILGTKRFDERTNNHNGFVEEGTTLAAGQDNYQIMIGNSNHTVMTENTRSYTIEENKTWFAGVDVGNRSAQTFADLDGDLDLDMAMGEENGTIVGYTNTGNRTVPAWTLNGSLFGAIDVGTYSTLDIVDIDGDVLKDLVVGRGDGTLTCYRNTGSSTTPTWIEDVAIFTGIDAGDFSAPGLDDLDGDGDLDLAIGESSGGIVYYTNTGTKFVPAWTLNTTVFNAMNTGNTRKPDTFSDPDFADIDFDGDLDFISGVKDAFWMAIVFYFNTGNKTNPEYKDIHNQWFDLIRMYEDAGNYTHIEWADINNDRFMETTVGRADGTMRCFRFIGNTTSERKGSNFVPLSNGSYRTFYDLGWNEGQYEITDTSPEFKDYFVISSPTAHRSVMRYMPDFARLAYRDVYYGDAYPWSGGNASYYPEIPEEHGQVRRASITFRAWDQGAVSSTTFLSQTGLANGFGMVPIMPMDYTSREVVIENVLWGQTPAYYDTQATILATPLKITSPVDLAPVNISIKIEPNKGDGQTIALNGAIKNLGGTPGTSIKFSFYGDAAMQAKDLLCTGTAATVFGLATTNVSCQWDLTGWGGSRNVFLSVDPDNATKELDEYNNIANNTLWVPFITWDLSPTLQVSNGAGFNNSVSVDLVVDSTGKVWAAWSTLEGKEDWDIGVNNFDGTSWTSATWITKGLHYSLDPSLAADTGGKVWLTYVNNQREIVRYVETRHPRDYWNTRDELYVAKYDGSWATPTRLTDSLDWNTTVQVPDMAISSDGTIWLPYRDTSFCLYCTAGIQIDNAPYNDMDILARSYNTGSGLWSANTTIDEAGGGQGYWNGPKTDSAGGNTWFVWDSDTGSNWVLKARKHTVSGGMGNIMNIPLPTDVTNARRPSISARADGTAWVVFESKVGNGTEIFVTKWDGSAWSTPTRLTNDDVNDIKAVVVTDSLGNPWVAWETWRNGDKDIVMRHFNGLFWSEEIAITSGPESDGEPALVAGPGGVIWVAWESDKNGLGKVAIFARKLTVGQTPPTITSASASPLLAYEDENVTFTGVAADTDGGIARYDWDLNGDGNYEWSSSKSGVAVWSYPQNGTYKAKFRAVDKSDLAVQGADWVTVIINNKAPVAVAGSDMTVPEDDVTAFNGSASFDTPADMALGLEYRWEFGDGMATGWSSNATASHVFTAAGVFAAKLTVRDDDLAQATSVLNVTVYNVDPVANITIGNLTGVEDETFTFEGFGVDTASDNGTVKWMWDFGDNTSTEWSRDPYAMHAYKDMGNYTAYLIVRDDENATTNMSITVDISNLAPVLNEVTGPDGDVQEDEKVKFKGSGTDTPSDVEAGLQYKWDFGDGQISGWTAETDVDHVYTSMGEHEVTFTVRDNNGAEVNDVLHVVVINPVPTATIEGPTTKEFDEDEPITFVGIGTDTESDLANLTYEWEFGDGTNGTGAEINHSYSKEDEFLVKLTVSDDEGATSMATIKVTINNPGPKVTISASNTTIVAGEQVDFTVTSVTDNPSDMEAGFEYAWDFKDGETATTANLTHTFKKAGTYDVTLTMTDDEGAKGTASVKITVKQAVIDDGGGDGGTAGAGNMGMIAIGGLLAVIVVIVIMVLMMRNKAKPAKADNMEKAENVKKKRKVEATPAPPPPTKTEPAPAPVVKTEAPK